MNRFIHRFIHRFIDRSGGYASARSITSRRPTAGRLGVALSMAVVIITGLLATPASAEPVRRDHISVELVAATQAAVPGQPLTVALRLIPDKHWHTYWRNPGDSGLPTRLDWTLPDGVTAGPIAWPFPERQPIGPLTNFGYSGEHFLLTEITVPADYAADSLTVAARARWLVCEDICIPGEAPVSVTVPVADTTTPSRWADALQATRQQTPQPLDAPAQYAVADDTVRVQLTADAVPAGASLVYFPGTAELVSNPATPTIRRSDSVIEIAVPTSEFFTTAPEVTNHVLVIDDARAVVFDARRIDATSLVPMGDDAVGAGSGATPESAGFSLPLALGFALLGGLILNLMPCVFPVLSIKAVSVAQSAGSAGTRRAHALFYTAGVVGGFLVLAIGLLAIRAAGQQIGWGFQLQSPVFVTALAWLMFLLGLSLAGAFDIGTRLMGLGDSLTHTGGNRGALITGLLACIVATPCTAPFMGTAMGFAVTQPPVVALTVFAALGLGMALPFLVIGFVPAAARLLPRPGAWMETFKQVMAFPMYATAVWLVWVLGRQTGVDGMAVGLLGAVLLGLAVWAWQRRGMLRVLVAGACVIGAGALLAAPQLAATPTGVSATSSPSANVAGADWQRYVPEQVAALQADGRAVFVNLTADWCVTCHVNERVALNTDAVIAAMNDAGVVRVKGDWTNRDPVITALLERHGRTGVPLYLLYPGRPDAEPVVLPQLLTPQRVIAAVRDL